MDLELGDLDDVLGSYGANIRNFDNPLTKATPDFCIDFPNATALLWRWEQSGIDVGSRWEELADKAGAQIGNVGHPLLVPHLMLALAATGRDAVAQRFLGALQDIAGHQTLWSAAALRDVVIPVCEAVLAYREGGHSQVVNLLLPRRDSIRLLGGSNAQRDMLHQMLAHVAMKAGQRGVVQTLMAHEIATRTIPPTQRVGYAAPARWAA